jgi:hypothetical protein
VDAGKANVGFIAFFLLNKIEECIDLLIHVRSPRASH